MMRTALKIFLIIVLQILITILFGVVFSIILIPFGWIPNLYVITGSIIAYILFGIPLYFALAILSKKFVAEDVKSLPLWVGIINLIFRVTDLLGATSLAGIIQVVLYPVLGYFITKLFLKNKFKI